MVMPVKRSRKRYFAIRSPCVVLPRREPMLPVYWELTVVRVLSSPVKAKVLLLK